MYQLGFTRPWLWKLKLLRPVLAAGKNRSNMNIFPPKFVLGNVCCPSVFEEEVTERCSVLSFHIFENMLSKANTSVSFVFLFLRYENK